MLADMGENNLKFKVKLGTMGWLLMYTLLIIRCANKLIILSNSNEAEMSFTVQKEKDRPSILWRNFLLFLESFSFSYFSFLSWFPWYLLRIFRRKFSYLWFTYPREKKKKKRRPVYLARKFSYFIRINILLTFTNSQKKKYLMYPIFNLFYASLSGNSGSNKWHKNVHNYDQSPWNKFN